ncbi:MAG: cation diffusion facilitator family transporter [Thermoplasmatota archaeon]
MASHARTVQLVLVSVLVVNVLLALIKIGVGFRSGSLSVLADAFHSFLDALGQGVAIILLRAAAAPPDEDHPYGHQKFETMGAFLLAGLLFFTAAEVLQRAADRLLNPQPVTADNLTVALLVVTLLASLIMGLFETRQGRRLGSDLLQADATHTRSDVFVSLSIIGGVVLSGAGYPKADGVLALVVGGLIAFTGYKLFARAFPVLTDRAVFEPHEIEDLVQSVPGVRNVHDIRSRGRRGDAYVQMHLVVEPEDVLRAHAITEEIEILLANRLGVKEAVIHVEPEPDTGSPRGGSA